MIKRYITDNRLRHRSCLDTDIEDNYAATTTAIATGDEEHPEVATSIAEELTDPIKDSWATASMAESCQDPEMEYPAKEATENADIVPTWEQPSTKYEMFNQDEDGATWTEGE